MKPRIVRLHSPDVYDLESYRPDIYDNFGFLLQIMAAPEGSPGEESFDVVVCTIRWFADQHLKDGIASGMHFIFMEKYDYEALKKMINDFSDKCIGENWMQVAGKLGRLGQWEFDDYVR